MLRSRTVVRSTPKQEHIWLSFITTRTRDTTSVAFNRWPPPDNSTTEIFEMTALQINSNIHNISQFSPREHMQNLYYVQRDKQMQERYLECMHNYVRWLARRMTSFSKPMASCFFLSIAAESAFFAFCNLSASRSMCSFIVCWNVESLKHKWLKIYAKCKNL